VRKGTPARLCDRPDIAPVVGGAKAPLPPRAALMPANFEHVGHGYLVIRGGSDAAAQRASPGASIPASWRPLHGAADSEFSQNTALACGEPPALADHPRAPVKKALQGEQSEAIEARKQES
jgi:hypothetical protein